jgi:hypothetical protein
MNPRLDRYGDPIEDPPEDDRANVIPIRPRQSVRQHIAELRRILADSRRRREAQP